jgi:hypothetical protein
MKVEEIAEAVAKLPPDQLARFRRWFTADLQEPSEELAVKTAHLKEKLTKLERRDATTGGDGEADAGVARSADLAHRS